MAGRHLIECPAVEHPSSRFLVLSAPLLEEKGCAVGSTSALNLVDPFELHCPRPRPRLATNDCPVNISEVHRVNRADQRFERNEPGEIRDRTELVDSFKNGRILDARANPDVRRS